MQVSIPLAAIPAPLQFVQHWFELSKVQFADRVALVAGAQTLTYAELGQRVDRLSAALRARAPEAALIGVSTARGPAMIISVLAILQAGKAYVPLDPAYPEKRLTQLAADAGLRWTLAPAHEAALFAGLGLQVLASDAEHEPETSAPLTPTEGGRELAAAGRLAYVLYTSGSTGQPKGVGMGHAALLNLLRWQAENSGAGVGTRTLQFAPLSFDVSFQEIFATLGTGGTLVLLAEAQRLDLGALLDLIEAERINRVFLPFVALQHLAEIAVSRRQFPPSLQEVMTAGEQLKITPQLAAFCAARPGLVLYNQYGPTEAHVVTQLALRGDPTSWERLPTIGQPIANTKIHLLAPDLQPVAPGETGELCISGACLAEGYLNDPARTAEKFITWAPPGGAPPQRLYRSGDRARQRPDGNLEFLGRQDEQVKIRGYRIEPGEVEAQLATLPPVGQVAVVAREDAAGQKELVAYVVPAAGRPESAPPDAAALRRAAAQALPDYLVPAAFVVLAEFPKTSSGKIDRRALPAPAAQSRAALGSGPPYEAPRTATERQLAGVWAGLLRLDGVGRADNFFELGGNSLLALKAVAQLQADCGLHLPVTKLYQYPTLAAAAHYLAGPTAVPTPLAAAKAAATPSPTDEQPTDEQPTGEEPTGEEPAGHAAAPTPAATADIAIISMAGRFPGANTLEELWDVLREGRETTSFFRDEELDASVSAELRADPLYVRARGLIDHAEDFDAAFFNLNPRLAAAMDPQQRVLLELAWEALEQTGHLPAHFAGRVGVFAGCANNSYYPQNVQPNAAAMRQLGEFQVMTVNEKDYVAMRLAYELNLRGGPAVSVHSACSTGLLAVAQAVLSLRAGQCEVALAGAASITAPQRGGYLYQEGAMFSPDGHCRPFDAQAQGTVFSDGAGLLLLKPLAAARRDGDAVLAVIKGVGVANDGGGKGSFSAPSAAGQAAAISAALADAQVAPASLSYVEAHGTATPLGDPIELEGLRLAFGPNAEAGTCALGSVKGNLGHLTAAAGVAGLFKTVLALQHRQLPPTPHYTQPNPHLALAGSPFFVNERLRAWPATDAAPRRAGISSFGVGGTNVHVILEEAEGVGISAKPTAAAGPAAVSRPVQLLTWSARTGTSAAAYAERLAGFLAPSNSVGEEQSALKGSSLRSSDLKDFETEASSLLADVAYTLQTTRALFAERRFVVAGSVAEAVSALPAAGNQAVKTLGDATRTPSGAPGAVVFLFPGQGAQHLNMGRELYERELVFRAAVDECAELLQAFLAQDLRALIYPAPTASADEVAAAAARLQNTRYAQPALFVTEYALAQLWLSWGIQPTALCGHSIGEFVAACLAGIFPLADALRLVATRGRLVSELPAGRMLAVRAEAAQVRALLPADLDIAAVNSRRAVVVSGPAEGVGKFADLLVEYGIPSRPLATSHAFHSAMMAPAAADLAQLLAEIPLAAPQRPIISTVTGTWLTAAQATDPAYWAAQLRAPVQFAAALDTVLAEANPLLLEVGPGTTLTALATQHAAGRPHTALASLPPSQAQPSVAAGHSADYPALLGALGQLWQRGLEPDWQAFYAGQGRRKLRLPGYCFDRQRCWLEPLPGRALVATNTPAETIAPAPPALPLAQIPTPSPLANAPAAEVLQPIISINNSAKKSMRQPSLLEKITAILAEAADVDVPAAHAERSFLELGLDSLLLTQLALTFKKEFQVPITFRQLNETLASPAALAAYLDEQLPAAAYQPAPAMASASPPPAVAPSAPAVSAAAASSNSAVAPGWPPQPAGAPVADSALDLITQQLQLLTRQVALLQGNPAPATTTEHVGSAPAAVVPPAPAPVPAAPIHPQPAAVASAGTPKLELTPEEAAEHAKPFGATARIERQATAPLTARQQTFLADFTRRYNRKTGASKAYAQQHRAHMADPRVVSGFSPALKELTYPLVVNRSAGARLWDLDGNEYVDALNGFGSSLFGHQPDFIKKALHAQIESGYEVGPQHALAGEVSQLICELTGHERAALCNTGSEAVLGALRVARTVTGRSLVVAFAGSYHGINDEVIVRGTRQGRSRPAAPGIMPEAVQNMLILDYGTPESLRIIRERGAELAAVLVEPVQSRRPEFQPVEFLRELRRLTTAAGTVLIFDEVITGFRLHLGGAQALFGVRADLATYGKVIGGGLSIGAIAGAPACMDALDGGHWQYGDDSVPEVGVTYFAGTFVRHPLALAAARASLHYLKSQGPGLQTQLNARAGQLADRLNAEANRRQLPLHVVQFGSLWKIKFTDEQPYNTLLFTLMREQGIHIWDNFPCFITEAHSAADLDQLVAAFTASAAELTAAGFFPAAIAPPAELREATPGEEAAVALAVDSAAAAAAVVTAAAAPTVSAALNRPPAPGARLGRDAAGNPAWFAADPARPGCYVQLMLA